MKIISTINTSKRLIAFTSMLVATVLLVSAIGCERHVPSPTPGDTVQFTDSVGRTVKIPRNIERIAPSGTLSQIILYTLCPEKLVGLTNSFSASQLEYIPSKYASLPTLGDFFGNTLNLEALMVANPQVIIDIGDPNVSGNMRDDLDDLQERTGIPVIFVEMDLATMVKAYNTLGEITGETEHAQELTNYIKQTLSETEQKAAGIPNADRVTVYYCQGDGLAAIAQGTFHSDVIDIVGGVNVTVLSSSIVAGNGTSTISMEQLMLWNPSVILFAPGSIYDSVATRAEWGGITAIQNGTYYEVPSGPFNWMGRPPSVNRILGIKWLANLLYPKVFSYDMLEETKEFYKLFYHCDLTNAQVTALLTNSTHKQ